MGLAASQARFLAITSRKAYCEFESTQIAQQKLSVTRELAEATDDYQNSLNATTLVWQYDDDYTYDLSYGLLMTPSVVNDYNPYLITDRTGAVVLNSSYAAAAEYAGIDQSGGSRSETGYLKFLEGLSENNIISTSTYKTLSSTEDVTDSSGNTVTQLVYAYNEDAGYGATPLSETILTNNVVGLAYQLKNVDISSILTDALSSIYNNSSYSSALKTTKDDNGNTIVDSSAVKFYSDTNEISVEDITLQDILTGNISMVITLADGYNDSENVTAVTQALFEEILNALCGVNSELYSLLGTDSYAKSALSSALTVTTDNYLENVQSAGSGKKSESSVISKLKSNASNDKYNGIYLYTNSGSGKCSGASVNLSTLMAYYLTEFELILNGYGNGYSLGTTTSASSYVTDDLSYTFVTSETTYDNTTVLLADYYQQLYNNICVNGWTENDNVDDSTYLENALKNGTYFITSLSSDGYFYQNRYNDESATYIVEVTDEDAIAQAEAEYTAMKAKLTYKEEKLDLEMTNLDTEISSLTTEYDTVKNLISKNVEKVFTMFQ